MNQIKRTVSMVCAAVILATALLLTGCSTPAVAMTVDDYQCSTGEYLANLYDVYYYIMYTQKLAQYASYGQDPWDQDMTLGEGDAAVSVKLPEYMQVTAQDKIVRQEAVRQLMAADNITVDAEELASLEQQLSTAKESEMIIFGFNKEHYKQMYVATNLDEKSLFYGWYNEGGQKAVSEQAQRQFFDDNYYSYKSIEISLQDSSGNDLSAEDIAAVNTRLQGYLDAYQAGGNFDTVISQYKAEEAAKTTTTAGATTTTASAETTTTTANTASTTQVAVSADVDTTGGTIAGADTTTTTAQAVTTTTTASTQEVTTSSTDETTDSNLKDLKGASTDEATLVEAIKNISVNSAAITQYNADGKTKTAALILRLDPTQAHGSTYFADEHDTLLYNMKWDEFDQLVKEKVNTLNVVKNAQAIKMCDPKKFDSIIAKNSNS